MGPPRDCRLRASMAWDGGATYRKIRAPQSDRDHTHALPLQIDQAAVRRRGDLPVAHGSHHRDRQSSQPCRGVRGTIHGGAQQIHRHSQVRFPHRTKQRLPVSKVGVDGGWNVARWSRLCVPTPPSHRRFDDVYSAGVQIMAGQIIIKNGQSDRF